MYRRFENLGPTLKVWLLIKTDSPPQLYIEDGAEWCVEWATVVGIGFLMDISWVCSDNALSEFVDADLDFGFPPSDRPKSKILNRIEGLQNFELLMLCL